MTSIGSSSLSESIFFCFLFLDFIFTINSELVNLKPAAFRIAPFDGLSLGGFIPLGNRALVLLHLPGDCLLLHLLLNLLLHLLDGFPLLLIGIDANGMWSGKFPNFPFLNAKNWENVVDWWNDVLLLRSCSLFRHLQILAPLSFRKCYQMQTIVRPKIGSSMGKAMDMAVR